MTVDTGEWSGATPLVFLYQWLDCDEAGAHCVAIDGAAARSYVPGVADIGRRLRVVVTATNAVGAAQVTSSPTEAVRASPFFGASPLSKEHCKRGGWRRFTNPEFRNQGQCIHFVVHGDARHGGEDDDAREDEQRGDEDD